MVVVVVVVVVVSFVTPLRVAARRCERVGIVFYFVLPLVGIR